jgi:hypothetical protein
MLEQALVGHVWIGDCWQPVSARWRADLRFARTSELADDEEGETRGRTGK